jgi:two-component system OmpR family sensor kinase
LLLAEKKALIKFVSVFVGFNTLFLVTLSILYYYYQKNIYIDMLQNEMVNYAETAYESIYEAEDSNKLDEYLLHDTRFDIAITDKQFNPIYPKTNDFNIKVKQGFFTQGDYYFFVKTIEIDSIKNIHYLILRTSTIDEQLNQTKNTITIVLSFSILFFAVVTFILSRLFLQPLRQYIELLNKFITDATHELNTPISILSMSLEVIDTKEFTPKNLKAIERILIAVRTLSHLYNDLTFIMFPIHSEAEQKIKLDELISQRIAYFMPLASTKNIVFIKELKSCEITVNERFMNRIIDNLFSNAIKYNKRGGTIKVELDEFSLKISDTGIGFGQLESKEIFQRYARLDNSSGGFGIGLSIVKSLCELYEITIDVHSEKEIGTTFVLSWKNSRIIHTS